MTTVPGWRLTACLCLVADDIDFTSGTGEEVRGRSADLMMIACGRTAALTDVVGPGVEVLRARLR